MTFHHNIGDLICSRSDHRSFHVAAEQHVRIEMWNLTAGDEPEPISYAGDVVLTCYRGAVVAVVDGQPALTLGELDQLVVPSGRTLSLACTTDATVQLIWAPQYGTRGDSVDESSLLRDRLSTIDALGKLGWVFVVKVDGERERDRYTVVASRGGDAFRRDGDDLATLVDATIVYCESTR